MGMLCTRGISCKNNTPSLRQLADDGDDAVTPNAPQHNSTLFILPSAMISSQSIAGHLYSLMLTSRCSLAIACSACQALCFSISRYGVPQHSHSLRPHARIREHPRDRPHGVPHACAAGTASLGFRAYIQLCHPAALFHNTARAAVLERPHPPMRPRRHPSPPPSAC